MGRGEFDLSENGTSWESKGEREHGGENQETGGRMMQRWREDKMD